MLCKVETSTQVFFGDGHVIYAQLSSKDARDTGVNRIEKRNFSIPEYPSQESILTDLS
jgi:hypothetical protein